MTAPSHQYRVREDRYSGIAMGSTPGDQDQTFFVHLVTCSDRRHESRVAGPFTRRRAEAIARAYNETETKTGE